MRTVFGFFKRPKEQVSFLSTLYRIDEGPTWIQVESTQEDAVNTLLKARTKGKTAKLFVARNIEWEEVPVVTTVCVGDDCQ